MLSSQVSLSGKSFAFVVRDQDDSIKLHISRLDETRSFSSTISQFDPIKYSAPLSILPLPGESFGLIYNQVLFIFSPHSETEIQSFPGLITDKGYISTEGDRPGVLNSLGDIYTPDRINGKWHVTQNTTPRFKQIFAKLPRITSFFYKDSPLLKKPYVYLLTETGEWLLYTDLGCIVLPLQGALLQSDKTGYIYRSGSLLITDVSTRPMTDIHFMRFREEDEIASEKIETPSIENILEKDQRNKSRL